MSPVPGQFGRNWRGIDPPNPYTFLIPCEKLYMQNTFISEFNRRNFSALGPQVTQHPTGRRPLGARRALGQLATLSGPQQGVGVELESECSSFKRSFHKDSNGTLLYGTNLHLSKVILTPPDPTGLTPVPGDVTFCEVVAT